MRFVTAILSIYLLFLTVLPCCVFDKCPEDRETTEAVCQTNTHKGGDKDGCGSCSPFFNCHHCPGFNVSVKAVYYHTKAIDIPSDKPVALEDHFVPTTYTGNIWQPPRA